MPEFLNARVQQYLDQLASGEPTPGGGSAAGLTGAMGAALLSMSAHFTVGRTKYADYQQNAQAVMAEAEGLRVDLQRLMEEDSVAYALYGEALALPKGSDEENEARRRAIQNATRESARAPLAIAQSCYRILQLAMTLAANCNPNLVSDVAVAAHLAQAAFHSAVVNVRLNLRSLKDEDFVREAEATLNALTTDAQALTRQALEIAYRVMDLPLEGDLPR